MVSLLQNSKIFVFTILLVVMVASCLPPPDSFDPEPPVVPPSYVPSASGSGLVGAYFDTAGSRVLTRTDSVLNFDWGYDSPASEVPVDRFSVVWTGMIEVPESGLYTFTVNSDDGVRLFIDGSNDLFEGLAWVEQGLTVVHSVTLNLSAGMKDIRVEYYENEWGSGIRLFWDGPGFVRQIVPREYLYPGTAATSPPSNVGFSSTPTTPPPTSSVCGNGIIETGEQCDNGSQNGVVCTATSGSSCTYCSTSCTIQTVQGPITTQPGTTQTINYNVDTTTDFINPERGWIVHVGSASQLSNIRSQGVSVVWTTTFEGSLFRLDAFRYGDISQQRLNELDNFFNVARNNGLKVKVRFSYNGNNPAKDPLGPDAPESTILRHIEQLAPLLQKHEDVIAMMDASFVGAWAEWHSSNFGLSDNTASGRAARARITNALLDALPTSRMIGHRTPLIVTDVFGTPGYITENQYFSESHQSRVGWLNDCFLMGRNNVGTYNSGNFDAEKNVFTQIGKYAVSSAETCDLGGGLSEYNTCSASIAEMELLSGPDLLHRDFWVGVYDRWRADGCHNEISTRLGYRFAINQGVYSTSVNRGSDLYVSLNVQNTGFGKLYNPRPLELVLRRSDGIERRFVLEQDARLALPLGGEIKTITRQVRIPSDMQTGTYQLYLALPDGSPSLRNDVRYSIRFANTGSMWDSTRGINNLGASVQIN